MGFSASPKYGGGLGELILHGQGLHCFWFNWPLGREETRHAYRDKRE